jgi:hypothetical protein
MAELQQNPSLKRANSLTTTPSTGPLVTAQMLAHHVSLLEPEKDAARLSLQGFLQNLCEPSEPVNSDLINRYLMRALAFPHWQQNKSSLFSETSAILHHFEETKRLRLPLESALAVTDIQVVPAENISDLLKIANMSLEATSTPYDKWRVVQDGVDRVIAVVLHSSGALRLTVFPMALAIRQGSLSPLHQEMTLWYGSDLQLQPKTAQQLDVGPYTTARFASGPEGIRGCFVRGFTFQKSGSLDGGALTRYPMLFYPLKRLEQFFINRKTDPMYIELTNALERSLEIMDAPTVECIQFAQAALERGRLALDHIFPDDKLVRLLINSLEKTLALQAVSKEEPWPTIRNLPV